MDKDQFLEKRMRIQSVLYGKLNCINCGEKIKGARYWVKASEDNDPELKPWCRYCAGVEQR